MRKVNKPLTMQNIFKSVQETGKKFNSRIFTEMMKRRDWQQTLIEAAQYFNTEIVYK